jgi:hypothetical protein
VAGLLRRLFPEKDPYWDRFVNRPLDDPKNLIVDLITTSPGGGVFAVKTEIHDSAAMTGHMVELAHFWGADVAGVASTNAAWLASSNSDGGDAQEDVEILAANYPCAIVCGIRRVFDAGAQGMGGRLPEQRLAVVNFNLRSYIREIGYAAEFASPRSAADPALVAGLGRLAADGRFLAVEGDAELVIGQIVVTSLPMEPSRPHEAGR